MRAQNMLPDIPKTAPEPERRPVEAAPRPAKPARASWVAPAWSKRLRASKPVPAGFAAGPEYWPAPPERTRTADGRLGVGSTDDRRRWGDFLALFPQIMHSLVVARITQMEVGNLTERLVAAEITRRATLPELAEMWRHLAGMAPSRNPKHVEHRRAVMAAVKHRTGLGVSRPQLAEICRLGYGTVNTWRKR
jgi:hypothetical protein